VLRGGRGGVVGLGHLVLGGGRQDQHLLHEHHAQHLLAEHDPGQGLVQRPLAQRLLLHRRQRPGHRGHDAQGAGQLRLGGQQRLGLDQREQVRRLVPAGLGDVRLHLAHDGVQRVHRQRGAAASSSASSEPGGRSRSGVM
jgi:hypothetical protein